MSNFNRLYYAGTTAIVYNFELDYKQNGEYPLGITTSEITSSSLKMYAAPGVGMVTSEVVSAPNTGVTEIGVRYAKQGEGWTYIKLSKELEEGESFTFDDILEPASYFWNKDDDPIPLINGDPMPDDDPDNPVRKWGTLKIDLTCEDPNDPSYCAYLLEPPVYYDPPVVPKVNKKVPRLMSYRVVLLHLEPGEQYTIQSYYKKTGVTDPITFNSVLVRTLTKGDVEFNCESVYSYNGAFVEDWRKELIKKEINQTCAIFNSMAAFTKAKSTTDFLNSSSGGTFSAGAGGLESGIAAVNTMVFKKYSIDVVAHEMAHNLMYIYNTNNVIKGECLHEIIPYIENGQDSNAAVANHVSYIIQELMEFATRCRFVWRWQEDHNYPITSSSKYSLVENFIVAAACYVLRTCVEDYEGNS